MDMDPFVDATICMSDICSKHLYTIALKIPPSITVYYSHCFQSHYSSCYHIL